MSAGTIGAEAEAGAWPADALPYGVGSVPGRDPGVVVAVGDHALSLAGLASAGLLRGVGADPVALVGGNRLNPLLEEGPAVWRALRDRLSELVTSSRHDAEVRPHLAPLDAVMMHLPFAVADFVDFYSSREHAERLGRLFRPDDEPLQPNWRHLPVGYHGRAGTVVVSDTPVRRPRGHVPGPDGEVTYRPTERLDVELEVGFVLGNPTPMGASVGVDDAADHVFGVALVNDWSARDIQAFEYRPLGPFLGKSFATSISAWVVPFAALESARVPGPEQVPAPLPHLAPAGDWALDLDLELWLDPANGDGPGRVSAVNAAGLYWNVAQQVTHLTANGASVRAGDLIATGTVSGSGDDEWGSLVEATADGKRPVLVDGVERRFLEDGDEVVLRGSAAVGPARIPLGEVRGRVLPAADG